MSTPMLSCRSCSESATSRREHRDGGRLNRGYFPMRRSRRGTVSRVCALVLLCHGFPPRGRSYAFQIGAGSIYNRRRASGGGSASPVNRGIIAPRPERSRGTRSIVASTVAQAEEDTSRHVGDDEDAGGGDVFDEHDPTDADDLPPPPHLRGLNPSQIEAVTRPRRGAITRVVAGPGAGKTRVLTCRIAHLLGEDDDDDGGRDRVLAVTFTKKASGEMQHRLEALLREGEEHRRMEMAQWDDDSGAIGGEDEDGSIREEEVAAEPGAPSTTSRPPRAMNRVTLGTFHSVCAKMLRWNGAELASLPSIVAGAAGGVTITIPGGEGDDDAAATASSVAALDGTFAIVDQSDQLRIVKETMKTLGIVTKAEGGGGGKGDIRPITILNAVSYLKSEAANGVVRDSGLLPPPPGKNDDDGKPQVSDKALKIARAVHPLYRRTLLSHNSLDFDDLILLARELLLLNPDARDQMHRRWAHVLVDEFQDTSRAQLDVIRLLTTRSLFVVGDGDQSIYSWRGANAESMTDFKEEFDGHDHGRIAPPKKTTEKREGEAAESAAEGLSVDTVYLMENYRSTANIVRAAQKILAHGASAASPSSSSAQAAIRKEAKPMRGKGPSPRVLACADAKAEASFVVKTIQGMVADGALVPGESTVALIYRTNAQSRALEEECVSRNLPYLIRGNAGTFYSRREIKDCLCFLRWLYNGRDRSAMLRAVKTPSRGIGDVAMSEFLRYCDSVDSFFEDGAAETSGPRPTPLDILIAFSEGEVDSLGIPSPDGHISKRALNRFLPLSLQMRKIRSMATEQSVAALLSSIVKELDLKAHFDSISKTSEEFADRWGNVMELLQAAARYSDDGPCLPQAGEEGGSAVAGDTPLGQFLDDVALLSDTQSGEPESETDKRVVANLMTIHASKGMEFDAVFLVGIEEGTLPTHRSIQEGDDSVELEEERRLCYVAMTRAKTHLVMTWRREVMTFFGEGIRTSNPDRSRFLNALVSKKSKKTSKTNARGRSQSDGRGKSNSFDSSREKGGILSSARRRRPAGAGVQKKAGPRRSASNVPSSTGMERRKGMPSLGPRRNSMDSWRPADASQVRRMQHDQLSGESYLQPSGNTRDNLPRRAKPGAQPARHTKAAHDNAPGASSGAENIPQMDSTMFFPVGSSVAHSVHGRGKVLQPPNDGSSSDDMLVRVEFDGGMELDLPVLESGLRHIYS